MENLVSFLHPMLLENVGQLARLLQELPVCHLGTFPIIALIDERNLLPFSSLDMTVNRIVADVCGGAFKPDMDTCFSD